VNEKLTLPIFRIVSESAESAGLSVWVVGGYVRDLFLARESKDIDFVTVGDSIALAEDVAKRLGMPNQVNIFKNFGTAHIKSSDWDYEFVGARKESYLPDSRKPIVSTGTLEDDQNRRDFTINALAISLDGSAFGELTDPFKGMQDLHDKIIRTPLDPDITFSDDPLRMLRAIRFAAQLGFTIEPVTYEGIRRNAHRIDIVSPERISDELNKMISSTLPSVAFKLMFDTGLLQRFFPELCAMQGVEFVQGKGHKDNFYHTLQVLDQLAALSDDLWLRWAAILHDIAKPATKKFIAGEGWTFHGHEDKGSRMVKGIFRRMRLPLNDKMKLVENLVRLHLRPIALTKENITDSAIRRLIFDAGEYLEPLMLLCKSDITSKNEAKVARFQANLRLVEEKIKDVEERDRIRNWQPPIDGLEIMQIFNLNAGKEVGLIKSALKEAILEGDIANNYDEARNFVIRTGAALGLTQTIEP
jgi:tRNA nucleotidyltransferase/poly(A) polymerase